jgi:hypothetical protein
MKEDAKIKQLLEKYLEGETTLREEDLLSDYFNNQQVRPEWLVYKDLFTFFEDSKMAVPQKTFVPPQTKRSRFDFFQKYAAVAMILLIGTMFYTQQQSKQNLGTYEDPEVALEETKKVLNLISYHINSSTKHIKHLNTLEETKTKYINTITPK